jgi:hypothetical protein
MEAEETQSVAPEDKGEKVSPASDEEVSAEGGEECADDSEGSSDEDEAEMGPIAIALRASPRSSRSSFSVMDEGVGAAEYPPSTDESPFSIVSNSSASPASCAVSPSPRATPVLLAGIPEASTSPASMKTYPTSCLKPNCAQPDAEQTVVKKPPVARRVSFSSALAFASAPVHQDKAGAASAELFS